MSYSRIYGRAFAFDSCPLESLEAQCFLEVSDSKHHPKLETARDPKSKNEGISLSCSHKQITFFSLPVPHDAIAFEFAVHESSQPKPFLHWLNDTQQFLLRIRQMGQHLFFRVFQNSKNSKRTKLLGGCWWFEAPMKVLWDHRQAIQAILPKSLTLLTPSPWAPRLPLCQPEPYFYNSTTQSSCTASKKQEVNIQVDYIYI